MKLAAKLTVVAALGVAGMGIGAGNASAAIACNGEGECWHVREHHNYRPEFGVVVHPDNWRWRESEHYRWHEHEGRGYWRNGVWVGF